MEAMGLEVCCTDAAEWQGRVITASSKRKHWVTPRSKKVPKCRSETEPRATVHCRHQVWGALMPVRETECTFKYLRSVYMCYHNYFTWLLMTLLKVLVLSLLIIDSELTDCKISTFTYWVEHGLLIPGAGEVMNTTTYYIVKIKMRNAILMSIMYQTFIGETIDSMNSFRTMDERTKMEEQH